MREVIELVEGVAVIHKRRIRIFDHQRQLKHRNTYPAANRALLQIVVIVVGSEVAEAEGFQACEAEELAHLQQTLILNCHHVEAHSVELILVLQGGGGEAGTGPRLTCIIQNHMERRQLVIMIVVVLLTIIPAPIIESKCTHIPLVIIVLNVDFHEEAVFFEGRLPGVRQIGDARLQ